MSDVTELFATLKNIQDTAMQFQTNMATTQAAVGVAEEKAAAARSTQLELNQGLLKEQQAASAKAVNMLRVNPEDANNALVDLLSQRVNLQAEQRALYEDVRRRQEVRFIDDPYAWANAKLGLNDTIERHNTVVDRANTVDGNISSLATTLDAAKATMYAGIAATSAVAKAQQAQSVALKAIEDEAKAAKDVALFNMTAWGEQAKVLNLAGEQRKKMYEVVTQQEYLSMARAAEKRQVAEFTKREKSEKTWEDMATGVSKYFGGAAISPDTAKLLWSTPGAEGDAFRSLAKTVITGGPIGDSPGDAIVASQHIGASFTNPEQRAVISAFNSDLSSGKIKGAGGVAVDPLAWKKLGPEGQRAVINNYIETTYAKPIKDGTFVAAKDGLYGMPTYKNLGLISKDVTSMTIWRSLSQMPEDQKIDYNQVSAVAIAAIKSGEYGDINNGAVERAVAEVENIFRAGVQYIGDTRGLRSVFGLPMPSTYYKVITGEGMLSPRSNVVDVFKRPEITRDFLTQMAMSAQPLRPFRVWAPAQGFGGNLEVIK